MFGQDHRKYNQSAPAKYQSFDIVASANAARIWEGRDISGWPVTTLLRGKVMLENGQFFGDLNDGQSIPRRIAPEILNKPAC